MANSQLACWNSNLYLGSLIILSSIPNRSANFRILESFRGVAAIAMTTKTTSMYVIPPMTTVTMIG